MTRLTLDCPPMFINTTLPVEDSELVTPKKRSFKSSLLATCTSPRSFHARRKRTITDEDMFSFDEEEKVQSPLSDKRFFVDVREEPTLYLKFTSVSRQLIKQCLNNKPTFRKARKAPVSPRRARFNPATAPTWQARLFNKIHASPSTATNPESAPPSNLEKSIRNHLQQRNITVRNLLRQTQEVLGQPIEPRLERPKVVARRTAPAVVAKPKKITAACQPRLVVQVPFYQVLYQQVASNMASARTHWLFYTQADFGRIQFSTTHTVYKSSGRRFVLKHPNAHYNAIPRKPTGVVSSKKRTHSY